MTSSEPFTSIGAGLFRVAAATLGRKPLIHDKHLKSPLVMRGIVAELPTDVPFQIADPAGRTHRGIYTPSML